MPDDGSSRYVLHSFAGAPSEDEFLSIMAQVNKNLKVIRIDPDDKDGFNLLVKDSFDNTMSLLQSSMGLLLYIPSSSFARHLRSDAGSTIFGLKGLDPKSKESVRIGTALSILCSKLVHRALKLKLPWLAVAPCDSDLLVSPLRLPCWCDLLRTSHATVWAAEPTRVP